MSNPFEPTAGQAASQRAEPLAQPREEKVQRHDWTEKKLHILEKRMEEDRKKMEEREKKMEEDRKKMEQKLGDMEQKMDAILAAVTGKKTGGGEATFGFPE